MTEVRLTHLKSDLVAGLKQGVLLAAAALVLILPLPARTTLSAPVGSYGVARSHPAQSHHDVFRGADFASHAPSDDARFIADWVADSANNRGLPFAILDKRDARLYVFAPGGRLIDASPVLLGAAPGDDSIAGIGSRPMAQVRPEEKTTPAGRFVSEPGRNAGGEDVVWVDYGAAVSMHRVRLVDPKERRLERLASPNPADRRISYGCINVPVAFFEAVVWPTLGSRRAVVYVLPESRDVHAVFADAYAPDTKASRIGATLAHM